MQPQSMTGYGRGIAGNFKVEARSLNHKHLDIQIKLPSFLYCYDNDIRKLVKSRFSRGHIEVSISRSDTEITHIMINKPLASEYYHALVSLKNELALAGEIDINVLASYRDIFRPGEDEKAEGMNEAVELALRELEKMRVEEGMNLVNDIAARVELLTKYIHGIGERRNEIIADMKQRLLERLKEFLGNITMDEARLIQEAAILIERSDITEEIVRFKSHISHIGDVLKTGDAIGKKLDFLVQELRREVSTIGSKTSDVGIANHVIEMKHEIEKIKEQIQNLQ
jgi:uncharacterized protein (TIGR00255 family)